MLKNKLIYFTLTLLAIAAFVAGYLTVGREAYKSKGGNTGNILDKFSNADPQTDKSDEITPFSISNRGVVSLATGLKGNAVIYFEKETGKLFEFDFDIGEEVLLSGTVLNDFLSAQWSPDKKAVISSFYSPTGSRFVFHSYENGDTKYFDANIRSMSFSPNGKLVAYYRTDETNDMGASGKILISEPGGSYPKKILDTRLTDIELKWPKTDNISVKTNNGRIFLLNTEGELTNLLDYGFDVITNWSKSGNKLLFSSASINDSRELFFKDINLRTKKTLNILTDASRCVWGIDDINIYCAVAKNPTVDEVYKINTLNNSKEFVVELNFTAKTINLTRLENYLVFTDITTNKPYGLKILK